MDSVSGSLTALLSDIKSKKAFSAQECNAINDYKTIRDTRNYRPQLAEPAEKHVGQNVARKSCSCERGFRPGLYSKET